MPIRVQFPTSLISEWRRTKLPCTVLLLFFLASGFASGFQKPGGRDTGTSVTPPTGGATDPADKRRNKIVKTPRLVDMTINAPRGCRIWINEQEVDLQQPSGRLLLNGQNTKASYAQGSGILTLTGLRPGDYKILARKPDFLEYEEPVKVTLDRENVLTIVLIPLPGRLTVSPSVGGADVEIFNLDSAISVGRYSDRLDKVEMVAGTYRVSTSKPGYRTTTREIILKPGESVYLEPFLEPLPRPTPTPIRPSIGTTTMSLTVERQDKYLILGLQGSSWDPSRTVGSVNVSLGGPSGNVVSGSLNGQPCRVDFVKLENIADGSLVEAPGPSNGWASMVVRVRPKDQKRPISFAINWNSLPDFKSSPTDTAVNSFTPAEVIQRVEPRFPSAAINSPITGTVTVLVVIDNSGSVISAKALDGPFLFRQVSVDAARKWKFRPATRDGRAVESEQSIKFNFER
jgi:TonB family protein